MERFVKLFALISLSAFTSLVLTGCDSVPNADTVKDAVANSDAEDLLDELIAQKVEEESWSYAENFLGEYSVSASMEEEGIEDTKAKLVFSYKEETDRVAVISYDEHGDNMRTHEDCEYEMGSKGIQSSTLFLHCTMNGKASVFADFAITAVENKVILEGEGYITSGSEQLLIATYTGVKVD